MASRFDGSGELFEIIGHLDVDRAPETLPVALPQMPDRHGFHAFCGTAEVIERHQGILVDAETISVKDAKVVKCIPQPGFRGDFEALPCKLEIDALEEKVPVFDLAE